MCALVTLLLGTQVVVNFDIYRRAEPESSSEVSNSKTADVVVEPSQPTGIPVEVVVEPSQSEFALSLTTAVVIGFCGLILGLVVGALWCVRAPPAFSSFRPVRVVRDGSGARATEEIAARFAPRGNYSNFADGMARTRAPLADHWY